MPRARSDLPARLSLFGAIVLSAVLAGLGAPPAAAQEGSGVLSPIDEGASLPRDPRLVEGRLENGFRYLILEHHAPPGRAEMRLRIDVGSLDELENERSMARLLQELSMGWARGAALERLSARGLVVAEDLTGRAQYDQTEYAMTLPDVDAETVSDALRVLGRIAEGGLIDGPSFERARASVLASLRAGGDAVARARAQWLRGLAGESLFGVRPPEGDELGVGRATPEGLAVFRERWARASNMTLIVVGDVEAERLAASIRDAFGALRAGAVPERQSRGVSGESLGRRGVIGSDPELARAQVALLRIAPVREPVRTVGALRRFVLERAAMLAMEVRLRGAMSAGRFRADRVRVFASDLFRSMHYTQIAASAEGASWRSALRELCREVAAVREHGFTRGEAEEARARLLAPLESLVREIDSVPSEELVRWISFNDAQGHTWVEPGAELALARRFLVEADAARLSEVFRELAPAGDEVLLVSAPEGRDPPTREAIVGVGGAALDAPTIVPPESPEPGYLLERVPRPGRIVEISAHPPSGVWSAVLDNGVRVHHKRVGEGRDRVVAHITLGVGEAGSEREALIREAAANAWDEPALVGLPSPAVRRVLAENRLKLRAWSEGASLRLEIETSTENLTSAMELVCRMLTDPVVEEPEFQRWLRRARIKRIERGRDPWGLLETALTPWFDPDADPLAALDALDVERVRSWMGRAITTAPIEAAIVGDVTRAEAFELCERYLGSLASRAGGASDGGAPAAANGELVANLRAQTVTPVSGVMVGVRACDSADVREAHLLSLAARILERRLSDALLTDRRQALRLECAMNPGPAGSGRGELVVKAAAVPEQAEALGDLFERELARLGATGVSERELESAKRRVELLYLQAAQTPRFWGDRLADLHAAGRSLDDLVGMIERQRAFTPEDVRQAVARAIEERARIRVIVSPMEGVE